MVVRRLLLFSLHLFIPFLRLFCWKLDMFSPTRSVRSHVLMCHKYRRIKGEEELGEPRWFFLVKTITGALVTSGGDFPTDWICSSAHIPPSARWHRKEVIPRTRDSHFSHRRKAERVCPSQLNCEQVLCWLVGCFSLDINSIVWIPFSERKKKKKFEAGSCKQVSLGSPNQSGEF